MGVKKTKTIKIIYALSQGGLLDYHHLRTPGLSMGSVKVECAPQAWRYESLAEEEEGFLTLIQYRINRSHIVDSVG